MLGNILLNDNLSLKERTRFLSLATLILALTSAIFIGVTTQIFQHFQPEAITHFLIYGLFFFLVRKRRFANQVGGFIPFAFLGTLIYFYLIPEAHEFIKVWGNVGLIFILFTVKVELRKWLAGLVVLLICGATAYYHVNELGGIIPVRLISTTCSAAFCAFIATYFLNIYDHRFRELTEARDEAETFRKVVENIPIKVYLVSKAGEIKFINAAVTKYLGYSKDELVGKSITSVSMGNDYFTLLELLQQKNEGEILCKEVEGKAKNGGVVHNELCASLINYEGEEVCLGVLRDVTPFKEARELEIQSEISAKRLEEKNKFLSIISHELRTPLNGIIGMLGMLEVKDSDTQDEILDIVQSSSNRLMEVLNDMLTATQLEKGNLKVNASNFEITELLDRVSDLLAPNSRSQNTLLKVNVPSKLVLKSDKLKVEQILTNLISNSIKFTKDGIVSVNVLNNEGDLVIDISDNGIGIPKEKQAYIFEIFAQADERNSRGHEGLGLGLAITKELVNLLGGIISMESVEGIGSTFTVTIPNAIEYDELSHQHSEILKNAKPIAIVEDNHVNRKVLKMMIEQIGFKSVEFVDGESFLLHENMMDFSFILLDIRLPQMSGEEVLQSLLEVGKELPKVIAMTAHVMESDKDDLLKIGFDEYLGKPFLTSDLKNILLK